MTSTPPDPLLAHRGAFPILADTCYLISSSLGAMPAAVQSGLDRYAQLWRTRGVRAWAEEWWSLGSRVAALVEPILGAPADSVSMQPNVSLATAQLLSTLATVNPDRRRVVSTDLHFPSVLYVLERWCRRHDLELHLVPAEGELGAPTEWLLDAIDDRTLLVAMSHVEFKTAWIHDVGAIAACCRERGAFLFLDVFQSAGVLPLELNRWGVDAAVGGCLKWLCGGPGNAFLYVDPAIADRLEPDLTGWMAHQAPFAFEPPPIRLRGGASRFLTGTPPVPAFYAAAPGLEIVSAIGIEAIREKSLRLTGSILRGAADRGWTARSPADPERRAGTVSLDVPQAEAVARELGARDVVVDYRPGVGLRLSPHFYNSGEECDRCLEEIAAILADGSWRRHRSAHGKEPT